MKCVVCGAEGAETYANAWERVRKRYPCCEGCVARFDPDVHWIPARVPEPTSADEAQLLGTMRRRLDKGDSPRACVRDALVAGVAAERIARVVVEIANRTADKRQAAERRSLLLLLFRRAAHEPHLLDETAFQAAFDDLDRWRSLSAR